MDFQKHYSHHETIVEPNVLPLGNPRDVGVRLLFFYPASMKPSTTTKVILHLKNSVRGTIVRYTRPYPPSVFDCGAAIR